MPERIIVRLPNWLGDTVMTLPALQSLRASFPAARLLCAGPWAALLEREGSADVLATYARSWSGRIRCADLLRAFAADTVVLFPNSFEAAAAARYWGARRRIGFAAGARTWLLTDALPVPSPRRHQIDEYLMLVERLGISPITREPRLSRPEPAASDRESVRWLLADAAVGRDSARATVGVHLGAAFGPAKVWASERIIEFCRLIRADGARPVLLGAPSDAALARHLAQAAPAANLVGRDSPALLPAVLAEMDVVVSGDTGIAHLAAALGTPVVALFGPTDPRCTAPRGRSTVVQHPVPCAPCFYRKCPIDHPCMRGITADLVRDRVWALCAGASQRT